MSTFLIFLILIPILAALLLLINILFSKYSPDKAKITPFECGFRAINQTRKPMIFPHQGVAVLFLVFDIELALIAPFSIIIQSAGGHALWIFIIFTCILAIGFIYEYYTNAINLIYKSDNKLNLYNI